MVDDGNVRTDELSKMRAVYWDKPVKELCPKCSMPFVLEKTTKKDGTVRYCQNEECDYKMTVYNADVTTDSKTEKTVSA